MHKIFYIIVFSVCFCTLIDCQGGGGGGGGGGGFAGGGHRQSCTTDECRVRARIVLCLSVGGICICAAIAICYYYAKGRPDTDNSTFAMQQLQEMHETRRNMSQAQRIDAASANVFRSGIWNSRYYQYGKWHGPHELMLFFNPRSPKITGDGWDDVGRFMVHAFYSQRTRRIALTKTYRVGTGNKSQNLGHDVHVQLTENANLQQFDGKWYVQTRKYHGEDLFALRFNRNCEGEVV